VQLQREEHESGRGSLSNTRSKKLENFTSSSSRMRFINHNWSATKQRIHPQSVAEIRTLLKC